MPELLRNVVLADQISVASVLYKSEEVVPWRFEGENSCSDTQSSAQVLQDATTWCAFLDFNMSAFDLDADLPSSDVVDSEITCAGRVDGVLDVPLSACSFERAPYLVTDLVLVIS